MLAKPPAILASGPADNLCFCCWLWQLLPLFLQPVFDLHWQEAGARHKLFWARDLPENLMKVVNAWKMHQYSIFCSQVSGSHGAVSPFPVSFLILKIFTSPFKYPSPCQTGATPTDPVTRDSDSLASFSTSGGCLWKAPPREFP